MKCWLTWCAWTDAGELIVSEAITLALHEGQPQWATGRGEGLAFRSGGVDVG